jgi:hypothetical protein
MTPTIHEIKAHLVAAGLRPDQLFKALCAVNKAWDEAEERFDRDMEAYRQQQLEEVVKVCRGAAI